MRAIAFVTLLAVACCVRAEEDASLVIGVRRDRDVQKSLDAVNAKAYSGKWFKPGISDAAFHSDAIAIANLLVSTKNTPYEIEEAKAAVASEKARCTKEFVGMLNWKMYPDPTTRRGAMAGIELCAPEGKVVGKSLAISAIYEPDAGAKKASIALVKARKDIESGKQMIDTWKSAFDEQGILPVNEPLRKTAVDAMHDIADKRVYQALLYYAMLEIRSGSADLVRMDRVAITGNGINLPIDLPVLELRGVEGNIIVPAMSSLRGATGQDFGHRFDRWREWINRQP